MIDRDELIALADETGLTPQVVEKDYVLGWLLAAIRGVDDCRGRLKVRSLRRAP